MDPIPHQTIYHLENKILAEKKSFPHVMSPASVKSFILHSPWQNMQKIETMFPLQRVKLLVRSSKNKDGVVKQDWDEYIGHGLNNKHWVLEKSKWSNPFYMPKLSAKIVTKDTEDSYQAQNTFKVL